MCNQSYCRHYFITQGVDINLAIEDSLTPLLLCAEYGHRESFNVLIQNSANVNKTDIKQNTAMMICSSRGNTSQVNTLLKNNADLNLQNNKGESALTIAVRNGFVEIVELLLCHTSSKENKPVSTKTVVSIINIQQYVGLFG